MAVDATKTSGVRRATIAAGDTAAVLAVVLFIVETFYRLLYVEIGARPLPEFSNLVVWPLGGMGMWWLVRRHLLRILRFQALVMSSARNETMLEPGTRRLFNILDFVSWIVVTVVIASCAWLIVGWNDVPSSGGIPVQGVFIVSFSFPALLGGGWLIMRNPWYLKILNRSYRRVIELCDAINGGRAVSLDFFIQTLAGPSVAGETAKRLACEYGDADTWLGQMQQAAKERRRHSGRTRTEKAAEDVGPAYRRLCSVGSVDVATADAMCALFSKDNYVDVVRDVRAQLTVRSMGANAHAEGPAK